MGSSRLPDKVMRAICGTPMIGLLLTRLRASTKLDAIVVATSVENRDTPLASYVTSSGYDVFRGSETDVLDRYYQAARAHNAQVVVRITADCPLIDPSIVDRVVNEFVRSDVAYASNVNPPTYPDGLDVEVFSFGALRDAWGRATTSFDREHVTPYIRQAGSGLNVAGDVNHSDKRWTVDTLADFEIVNRVFEYFSPRLDFS